MFATIRKHQPWLLAIIITLTIVSFVVFFSPYSRTQRTYRRGGHGAINGQAITDDDFSHAYKEVLLQYYFRTGGNWLSEAESARFEPERQTYIRLLLIQKQEDLGIHVSSKTAADFATQMLQSMRFNPPQAFVEKVLQPRGIAMEDLERFIRHELGLQELMATAGASGRLVTTQEVKSVYIRENETLAAQAVFFSGSNYVSQVSAPPDAVAQFYTNQMPNYRLPERMQVAYVKFPLSNYLASAEKQITNMNELVDINFQRYGSNYLKDAKTPEEAKAKLKEDIIKDKARMEAEKQARSLDALVFDAKPVRPENLDIVAKSNDLTAQVSAPFDRDTPPAELDVPADFTKLAFRLSAEEPFSSKTIHGSNAVYVIAFNKLLPSENPSFQSISNKVVFDYKYSQALSLARKAGIDFDKLATNGMAQGKSFETLCAEAKVTPVTLPPFSLSTRELPEVEGHLNLRQFLLVAFGTPIGKTSGFKPTLDGGLDLFVKSKSPPDDNKIRTELPVFVNNVRQTRQREAFEQWFEKEGRRALADIPYFQEKAKEQQQQMKARSAAKS